MVHLPRFPRHAEHDGGTPALLSLARQGRFPRHAEDDGGTGPGGLPLAGACNSFASFSALLALGLLAFGLLA